VNFLRPLAFFQGWHICPGIVTGRFVLKELQNDGSLFGHNVPLFAALPSRFIRERHGF
jgi:hypothetical protein